SRLAVRTVAEKLGRKRDGAAGDAARGYGAGSGAIPQERAVRRRIRRWSGRIGLLAEPGKRADPARRLPGGAEGAGTLAHSGGDAGPLRERGPAGGTGRRLPDGAGAGAGSL